MTTKLCKDCLHGKVTQNERYTRGDCWHELALDVVTGLSRVNCQTMRERHSVCGEGGALWTPRAQEALTASEVMAEARCAPGAAVATTQ